MNNIWDVIMLHANHLVRSKPVNGLPFAYLYEVEKSSLGKFNYYAPRVDIIKVLKAYGKEKA